MVSEATVRELAALAEKLSSWLEGASDLNRKLSAPEYQELVPITTFVHPPTAAVESPVTTASAFSG